MNIGYGTVWANVLAIREHVPLVHNITNYVVMNTTANALLSIGASPVMAHAEEEVADMVGISNALVVNIGTLSEKWILSIHKAMIQAGNIGVPIILDPVGAGATPYRTKTALHLLSITPVAIIRGNASEISALAQDIVKTKGVDSSSESESALNAANELCRKYGSIVCITGKTDIVVSNDQTARIMNGHPMMQRVTGLGCTSSALCGAFLAVNASVFAAAVHAMVVMGIAGEMAAEQAKGPGSLQLHFLDILYSLTEMDIQTRMKLVQ